MTGDKITHWFQHDHSVTRSDVRLPAEEGGALAGAAVAGRGGDCEGGVRVVTQVSLPLTGHLAITAVLVLKQKIFQRNVSKYCMEICDTKCVTDGRRVISRVA